jgi:hypothetical protein
MIHSFHLLTWVRANRDRKALALDLDLRKLLIWKATTGLGYSLNVRVCSLKFSSMFGELKNLT